MTLVLALTAINRNVLLAAMTFVAIPVAAELFQAPHCTRFRHYLLTGNINIHGLA